MIQCFGTAFVNIPCPLINQSIQTELPNDIMVQYGTIWSYDIISDVLGFRRDFSHSQWMQYINAMQLIPSRRWEIKRAFHRGGSTLLKTEVLQFCRILKTMLQRHPDGVHFYTRSLVATAQCIKLQEPCVLYIGRAHLYPLNTPFYIFIQQIHVLNFLNMLHTLRFFLFKMPFIS